ncbi:hypothetical protein CS542_05615 [Pedobacter sp. IW39]|nr:hypothetical protein CS542_05615 [Pedobacter sp. IW39]
MKRRGIKNVALLLGGALSATTMGVLFESCNVKPELGEQVSFHLKTGCWQILPISSSLPQDSAGKAGRTWPVYSDDDTDCYRRKVSLL